MPPAPGCPGTGPSSPEVTRAICRVPSTPFSQAPWYPLPVHLCRFRVRSVRWRCFLERRPSTPNPIRGYTVCAFVTSSRLGNINPIPIDYGFRPRLRGRLTLRGLTLRRNPWTFGGSVSHTPYRYSCQHSHFRYLQDPSRDPFAGLRNAPLPVQMPDDRHQGSERRFRSETRSTLQHLGGFPTSLPPSLPGRLVEPSRIEAAAQPHPVGRARRATPLGVTAELRPRLPPLAAGPGDAGATRLACPPHLSAGRMPPDPRTLQAYSMDRRRSAACPLGMRGAPRSVRPIRCLIPVI